MNLSNELRKIDELGGLLSILLLFRKEINMSMNVRFYLSYDIKVTLKSHFWYENV